MVDEAESNVIDEEDIDEEEDEGFLFGVDNQATKNLREYVITQNKLIKLFEMIIQETKAAIQEKKAALLHKTNSARHEQNAAIHIKNISIHEKDAAILKKNLENLDDCVPKSDD